MEHEERLKEFQEKSALEIQTYQAEIEKSVAEKMKLKENYDNTLFKLEKNKKEYESKIEENRREY